MPTLKCLNEKLSFNGLIEKFKVKPPKTRTVCGGSISMCPMLMIVPAYIEQQAFDSQEHTLPLDRLDAYCIAPRASEHGSCFHQQELDIAQNMLQDLISQETRAELPDASTDRKRKGEFVWEEPVINNAKCTPKTCLHAFESPPGYSLILRPDGNHKMNCLHQECGQAAQAALVDQEKQRQIIEREKMEKAIIDLRRITIKHTLFAKKENCISLLDSQT